MRRSCLPGLVPGHWDCIYEVSWARRVSLLVQLWGTHRTEGAARVLGSSHSSCSPWGSGKCEVFLVLGDEIWPLYLYPSPHNPGGGWRTDVVLSLSFFFFLIYLFLAVLGLRFCARAFSSCGKRGPLFIAVRGPLTVAASLVAEHRLQTRRLSSCGSRAQLLCGMWDLPRPGLEPVCPVLAGRFSTTAPPGKPLP